MNAQARTYTEMLGAGLNSLPDEVLLEILTLVVETQRTSLVALELSQVCKRFRRVVLGSPMVWSNIHPASHSHRMVSIYAERNRSLGLNVTLTLTNKHILPQLQFLKAVVSAQAHWRSLSIEVETHDVADQLDSLNVLRGNTPLPKLKHLCITASKFYSQPFNAEETNRVATLLSSLQARNLISIATTDLVPNPLSPSLSRLTIYLHSVTNLISSTMNNGLYRALDHNYSVKELGLIFYFPENDNGQIISDHPTTFDEVEALHIRTPHVKKRGHGGARILFAQIRLPKLRTVVIDYDFKSKHEAKPKDMDLHSLDHYYLQAPLFENGLECLVLKLYKSCRFDIKRQLPIAFHRMSPVRELRIETPHPFASLKTYMEGEPMPAFRRVVFHECGKLTSEWLHEFVDLLRRDDTTWITLDKIIVNRCPLVDINSLKRMVPKDKLSY